ncbi:Uncharacterized protein APZ42_004162 [Daphnia magna]|uniref:Uncharacterized protein n=1 Tax=Daphnia magna TaxID=35525 RepID=A0A164H8A7_9CRUS|nr:Uncharacterized protein APZ42_004162 [Daphnia magna]
MTSSADSVGISLAESEMLLSSNANSSKLLPYIERKWFARL